MPKDRINDLLPFSERPFGPFGHKDLMNYVSMRDYEGIDDYLDACLGLPSGVLDRDASEFGSVGLAFRLLEHCSKDATAAELRQALRSLIGALLKGGSQGWEIRVKTGKKGRRGNLIRLMEQQLADFYTKRCVSHPSESKTEAAVTYLMQRTGRSRSSIFKAVKRNREREGRCARRVPSATG